MLKSSEIFWILVIIICALQGYKADSIEEPCKCVPHKNCDGFVPPMLRKVFAECENYLHYCCPESDIRNVTSVDNSALQGYKADSNEEPCKCVPHKNCDGFVPPMLRKVFAECENYLHYCCPESDIRNVTSVDNSALQGYKADSNEEPCKCVPHKNCDGFVPPMLRTVFAECGNYLHYCCPESDIRNVTSVDNNGDFFYNHGCGYSNPNGVNFSIENRGLYESQYGEFPWMVAILLKQKPWIPIFIYRGGGSLIHPKVVLTGSHLVYGLSPNSIKIRAGEWDTMSSDEPYPKQDRIINQIVMHDSFNNETNVWGISLLFFTVPIKFGPTINSICLPPPRTNFTGESCFVTGWGKLPLNPTNENMYILKKIPVPVIEHYKCRRKLRNAMGLRNFQLNRCFICAGGKEGLDACTGDGGSPLMCPIPNEKNRFYLAGVVSWGLECGRKDWPGVYVSTAKMRDWIDEVLNDNGIKNNSTFTL